MIENAPVFKRIVLKLSGEALKKKDELAPLEGESIRSVCERIEETVNSGVQVAVVVGGGNFFRGIGSASEAGVSRITGDHIGMLATVMNSLALREALEKIGLSVVVMTAIELPGITEIFDRRRAEKLLDQGQIVILGAGTGHPFFTTDTTAALRACEINAEAVFKATKVNGVFSGDPIQQEGVIRYRSLSFDDALRFRLKVMDSTAFSLCRDNNIPIIVFDFQQDGSLARVVRGDNDCATFVGNLETKTE